MATFDALESPYPQRSSERYRGGAIAFHWAMFVLVVVVGVLGLLHDSWPRQTQAYWINVHAMIGIALWLLLVARFRLRHAPPPLPTEVGAFSRRFSSPVHFALYALMFVIPIIGVLTFVYHGRVFHFGRNPAITCSDSGAPSPTITFANLKQVCVILISPVWTWPRHALALATLKIFCWELSGRRLYRFGVAHRTRPLAAEYSLIRVLSV